MIQSPACTVLQPVSSVYPPEPEIVLPDCQGDSFSGCASNRVPQTAVGDTWESPLRSPLPTTPTLHIATIPPAMRHSARPPSYLSPFPCSPHPVTYRGTKDLASLSWMLGLVPNAEVATGIRCWSWGWMPYFPWRFAGWSDTQDALCHLPAKALRGVKAAKMSPLHHSTVKRITPCLSRAATGSSPNWIMTWKLNWNLWNLTVLWYLCTSLCPEQHGSKTNKEKRLKNWASGQKTPSLLNYVADEATLVAYKLQTNRVGCCNYMSNLSKGFSPKISTCEKYLIVLELFHEKCFKRHTLLMSLT